MRLCLSFVSDSKHFKRAKTKDIEGAKQPNTKRNTKWAVKAFQCGGDGIIVLQKRTVRCVRKTHKQLTTFLPISISIGLSVAIGG